MKEGQLKRHFGSLFLLVFVTNIVLASARELGAKNIIYQEKLFCGSKNIINWETDFLRYCLTLPKNNIQLYVYPDKNNFKFLEKIRKLLAKNKYVIEVIRMEDQRIRDKLIKCIADETCNPDTTI